MKKIILKLKNVFIKKRNIHDPEIYAKVKERLWLLVCIAALSTLCVGSLIDSMDNSELQASYLNSYREFGFYALLTLPVVTVLWVLRTYDKLMNQKIASQSKSNQKSDQ